MLHRKGLLFSRARITFFASVLLAVLNATAVVGCGADPIPPAHTETIGQPRTSPEITGEDLAARTRTLSDDRMLGRAPGGEGEAPTLEYLQAAYERIGLAPAGDTSMPAAAPGSPHFLQKVDLVGITANAATASLSFRGFAEAPAFDLEQGRDFVTRTSIPNEVVDVSGEAVFVGYGIAAPEESWNDFDGIDVTGKILLVLPGEPPIADPDRFGGEAMTYYGRWTYKIEEGARRGAAGVLLIHDPDTAGYTWDVIKGRTGEALQKTDRNVLPPTTPLQGWLSGEAAARVFRAAGLDLDQLAVSASREGFTAVDLGATAAGHLDNTIRQLTSYNVIGMVEGSDPGCADESIIYVAHWDHLGVGEEVEGDAIYNGALDNAIGTASLLEVAEAWASVKPAPRRTALFIASTAEESGFLGVVSYIENPVVPLDKTLAAINIDGVNVFGPTDDVWIVGEGLTTLEDDLAAVLAARGRHLSPDPAPEQGNFFRSDHFPFAQVGIPALCVRPGMSVTGKPEGYGSGLWSDYYSTRYHRPSDEFDESWDFDSAAEDVEVMFEVGLRVSAADTWPEWHAGSEFKAARDTMLR